MLMFGLTSHTAMTPYCDQLDRWDSKHLLSYHCPVHWVISIASVEEWEIMILYQSDTNCNFQECVNSKSSGGSAFMPGWLMTRWSKRLLMFILNWYYSSSHHMCTFTLLMLSSKPMPCNTDGWSEDSTIPYMSVTHPPFPSLALSPFIWDGIVIVTY